MRKVVSPTNGIHRATSRPHCRSMSPLKGRDAAVASSETTVRQTIPRRATLRASSSFLGSMIAMS